jgi:hypothetical protein
VKSLMDMIYYEGVRLSWCLGLESMSLYHLCNSCVDEEYQDL